MNHRSGASTPVAKPDIEGITAVILAGGFGTRLRQAVADRPKILAEVRGSPLLAHLLGYIGESGVKNVLLCTGYMGDRVRQTFGNAYRGISLAYSQETTPLGTAGALRLALPLIDSDCALVMNGDSLCEVNLSDLLNEHHLHGAEGSMVVTASPDTSRYGKVEIDANGFVKSFAEKSNTTGGGWINAGIYLFNRGLIETIPTDGEYSLERQMFPVWTQRRVYGYKSASRFLDIGTPESYALAEEFLNNSNM